MGISSICGGWGTCHSCKVQVLGGTVSKPTSNELEAGWRLACQTYPTSDCKLTVPAESMTTPQRVQVEGLEITVHPEPLVRAYRLQLAAPSLSAPHADADRDVINNTFVAIVIAAGVTCLIVDVAKVRPIVLAADLVLANDKRARRYIEWNVD